MHAHRHDSINPFVTTFPTVAFWIFRGLIGLAFLALAFLFVLVWVVVATAALVTLPPANRPDLLCAALGTEAPCATEEIGHVKGTLTFVADDAGAFVVVLLARGKSIATDLGVADEALLMLRLEDLDTDWAGLVAPQATWSALRMLAKVTEGVPVLLLLTYKKGGTDMTDQVAPTTALARVRIALVRLR